MTVSALELFHQGIQQLDGGTECSRRCAVGRLYYAAYHEAKDWHGNLPLPGSQGTGPGGGVHQQLINWLTNPDPTLPSETRNKSKKIGFLLRNTHARRITADYHLSETLGEADAQAQKKEVSELLRQMTPSTDSSP